MPDLPHLSWIPRKPEPFGTKFKTAADEVTGILSRIEIQKGQDGMEHAKYAKELGGQAACAIRLLEDSQGCGRDPEDVLVRLSALLLVVASTRLLHFLTLFSVPYPSDLYQQSTLGKGDSFFASVKAASFAKKLGMDFVGIVKNCHQLFPKAGISEVMKNWPGGTYCVFYCEKLDLYAVGYKYNKTKVLHFITPGANYKTRYSDSFGNACTRAISRPQVISDFFNGSNVIDVHNHLRQFELGLEKLWLTQNCWFRVDTTIMGMTAIDLMLALQHGLSVSHSLKSIDVRIFMALLSKQFYLKAQVLSNDVNAGTNIPLSRQAAKAGQNAIELSSFWGRQRGSCTKHCYDLLGVEG